MQYKMLEKSQRTPAHAGAKLAQVRQNQQNNFKQVFEKNKLPEI